MRAFLWAILVLDQLSIIVVGATDLGRYEISEFQLKQKQAKSESEYKKFKKIHKHLPLIRRQQQLELLIAFSVGVLLYTQLIEPAVVGLGWALFILLLILVLKRMPWVQKPAYDLFEKSIDVIIPVAKKFRPLWWLVGMPERSQAAVYHSKEEALDSITRAKVFSDAERSRIANLMSMEQKQAKDIMTPAKRVKHISPNATLGPVLLDDLEKTGHGYFPVISKKDGVVGVLDLKQLANIGTAKQHQKMQDIMNEHLVWVPSDMTVSEVIKVFLHAKQYAVFVENEDLQFGGIITVADLLEYAQ